MNVLRTLLVLILTLSTVWCEESELLSLIVIFRHGSRAPQYLVKSDPYNSKINEIWPNGISQLTSLGKNQHYALGQWYRQQYKDFIPDRYDPNFIRVLASNIDRCLMSAAVNLAGLFPPKDEQIWNPNLLWQPIPIHTQPQEKDVIIINDHCFKFEKKYVEFMKTDYFIEYDKGNKDLYDYLSKHAGEEIRTLEDVSMVHDSLFVENYYNLTLPDWSKTVFPDKTLPLLLMMYTSRTNTTELSRLKVGGLVDCIATFFEQVINDSEHSIKFLMISGQDSTIVQFLNSFQAFDNAWPEYASTLIFELRRNKDGIFLNVNFKNSTTFRNVQLKECDFDCPFEQFQEIIKPVRVDIVELEKECWIDWLL